MAHSQKFVEAVEQIYKLAAQIPDPKNVVLTANIPVEQKRKYILLPDGSYETRKFSQ